MADPIIRVKRSSVEGKIPTPDQLPIGEVALNTFDGKFYASKNVGIGTTVFAVNPWTVGTGTNTYNTFFTAGNVGVGSTLPSSKLDVIGDAKFTGIVTSIDGRLISGIGINTTGGNVGYGVTTIDFRGSGISTVTVFSGIATINITGGAGAATTQTPGRIITSYSTTAGINTYNVTYEVGYLDAFLNGSRLSSTEYIATNGTSITLNEGPSEGDALDLIFYTLGIGDTGPQGTPGTIYWTQTSVGIHTLSSVGIGTTNPTSSLTVVGNTLITGIATVGGDVSFNGNVTLGDNTAHDITVGGEFVSNLVPSTTDSRDLGSQTQKWRNVWISQKLDSGSVVVGSAVTINSTGIDVTGVATATSFIKSGGTSTQFLKADGSVDSNTYITGVGIQSGGTVIGYGITTLNFVGTGNTFAVSGSRVDISISGSGGGGGSSSQWVTTAVGIHTLDSVGIGTTNPTSKLTVSGNVLVTGVVTATDFNSSSDLTLKTDISSIPNPLDKVIQINGVEFTWKENGKKSAGVIAQEVEKVLPNLVNGDDIKTVNYNGLIGLLIEVVKDQQKQIDEINNKLKSLEINT